MKLKDIVRESRETYKGDMSGIPVVGLEHLIPEEICFSDYEMCSDKTFTKAFHKGQVLFGRRRAYQKKAAVAHVDGVCSGDIMVLEAIPGKVEPSLLPFIIQNDRFFDYAIQHSEGGLSPRVKWNAIANYEFDLPSIEEQKVLADKLWAAYKVKESYRQLLSTTDEMLKAKFQEMFGDPFTNSKKWKEYGPFSKYTEIILGTTPKSSEPSFWDGNVLWITPAEMNDEVVLYEDTIRHITLEGAKSAHLSILPKGTVLFSTRAPIGKVGIVGKEMYCNQGFKNFHCGELLNEYYLYYSLLQNREYLQSLGTGSTFKELSKSTIEKLCIAVPPIEQQLDFERVFTQAEATKASLRASIEAIDRVIRSLINQ